MDLDNDFEKEGLALIQIISARDSLKALSFNPDGFKKLVKMLQQIKPKSRTRKHKRKILDFLTLLANSSDLNRSEYIALRRKNLDPTISFLQSYHGIYEGNYFVHGFTVLGFLIDVILSLFGVARFYYYVPVFMIVLFCLSILKYRGLRRKGKILDL